MHYYLLFGLRADDPLLLDLRSGHPVDAVALAHRASGPFAHWHLTETQVRIMVEPDYPAPDAPGTPYGEAVVLVLFTLPYRAAMSSPAISCVSTGDVERQRRRELVHLAVERALAIEVSPAHPARANQMAELPPLPRGLLR